MWQAVLAAGLSAAGGLFQQKAAKSAERRAQAAHFIADQRNQEELNRVNSENWKLGSTLKDWLSAQKETTTEKTKGYVSTTQKGSAKSRSYVDYEGMMKAAEAAGFNPQTFLNAGGLQAYTVTETDTEDTNRVDTDMSVTTTRKGHNALGAAQIAAQLMSPQAHVATAQPTHHIPHAGEAVVSGLQAGLNQFNSDKRLADTQAFQRELLNTQLAAIQKAPPMSRSFFTPGFSTSGSLTQSQQQAPLAGLGSPIAPSSGEVKVTNPWDQFLVEPKNRDASALEERYGEVGGSLLGIPILIDDAMLNLTKMTKDERRKAFGEPFMKWLSPYLPDFSKGEALTGPAK